MRFNELISGTRSDIAVKVFGEDLMYWHEKHVKLRKLSIRLKGSDIIIEKQTY
jgi:cobalt-zinc-cadmium resistance protein CzcA